METSFTVFERDVRIAQRHDYWLGSTCSVSRYGGSVLDRSVLIWKSNLVVAADTHPVRKKKVEFYLSSRRALARNELPRL